MNQSDIFTSEMISYHINSQVSDTIYSFTVTVAELKKLGGNAFWKVL